MGVTCALAVSEPLGPPVAACSMPPCAVSLGCRQRVGRAGRVLMGWLAARLAETSRPSGRRPPSTRLTVPQSSPYQVAKALAVQATQVTGRRRRVVMAATAPEKQEQQRRLGWQAPPRSGPAPAILLLTSQCCHRSTSKRREMSKREISKVQADGASRCRRARRCLGRRRSSALTGGTATSARCAASRSRRRALPLQSRAFT